jgi:methylase of polypeptide subunit release factors
VLDPLSRLDGICDVKEGDVPKPASLSQIPRIIFSESRKELEEYNFQKQAGSVVFQIDGQDHSIHVRAGVRKPGHFSMVTLQIVRSYVEKIGVQEKVTVWDMGCGSGFVGLLSARLVRGVGQFFCSDIRKEAIKCAAENIQNLGLDERRITLAAGDLFEPAPKGQFFDVIAFNAPFLPESLANHSNVDSGGQRGVEIALRFCAGAKTHLQDGGWAILTLADYVDNGTLHETLEQEFGIANVQMDERLILYPCKPPAGIPRAYEVEMRHEIEKCCNYRFETCWIGGEEFIAFNMRYYCARRSGNSLVQSRSALATQSDSKTFSI